MSLISGIGGLMVGHVLVSFALENKGFKDYRLWVGVVGFVMTIFGFGLSPL